MTRFQVSDKFAGKKGPCPKCGHIIEIPKENLVIHEPDSIISGKKKIKGGESLRPISRSLFVFTRNEVLLSIVGVLVVILVAFLLGLFSNGIVKSVIAVIGVLGISFPLAAFGYMMVRDPEDLEIFLGNELYRRSFWVALGLCLAWFALEIFLLYLNPGVYGIVYLTAIALLASFIPFIVFDTDYGKGLLIFILFAVCVITLRGLAYAPHGWIWQQQPGIQMALPFSTSTKPATPTDSALDIPNDNQDSSATSSTPATPSTSESSDQTPKQSLTREAPDPSQKLRRR